MSNVDKELEKEVLDIADYLGCNGSELWSEMSKLIAKEVVKELERLYATRQLVLDVTDSGVSIYVVKANDIKERIKEYRR